MKLKRVATVLVFSAVSTAWFSAHAWAQQQQQQQQRQNQARMLSLSENQEEYRDFQKVHAQGKRILNCISKTTADRLEVRVIGGVRAAELIRAPDFPKALLEWNEQKGESLPAGFTLYTVSIYRTAPFGNIFKLNNAEENLALKNAYQIYASSSSSWDEIVSKELIHDIQEGEAAKSLSWWVLDVLFKAENEKDLKDASTPFNFALSLPVERLKNAGTSSVRFDSAGVTAICAGGNCVEIPIARFMCMADAF